MSMKLDHFLSANGIVDAAFAVMVGTDRTTISRARRGKTMPSSALMRKIAEVTGNDVRPDDFFDLPASDAVEAVQ